MTIADFCMVSLTFNILRNTNGRFSSMLSHTVQEFPKFNAYADRLQTECAANLDSRAQLPF